MAVRKWPSIALRKRVREARATKTAVQGRQVRSEGISSRGAESVGIQHPVEPFRADDVGERDRRGASAGSDRSRAGC